MYGVQDRVCVDDEIGHEDESPKNIKDFRAGLI